jgi:hypothetical protein
MDMSVIFHAFDVSFLSCPFPYIIPELPHILIEAMEQFMAVLRL